jgi:hypothetical protein
LKHQKKIRILPDQFDLQDAGNHLSHRWIQQKKKRGQLRDCYLSAIAQG